MGELNMTRAGIRARTAVARKRSASRQRDRIALRYAPSARELFVDLVARLQASRPVFGNTRSGVPIFGAPTFRNVIDENGKHV